MANCCEIIAQFASGMVHFFRIFRYARYTSFSRAASDGEYTLVLCYLTDLTVIAFYHIGRVDQLADHRCILEIFGKAFPIVSPGGLIAY